MFDCGDYEVEICPSSQMERNLGVRVTLVTLGNFDLAAFKVISGHLVHSRDSDMRVSNAAPKILIIFQQNIRRCSPFTDF